MYDKIFYIKSLTIFKINLDRPARVIWDLIFWSDEPRPGLINIPVIVKKKRINGLWGSLLLFFFFFLLSAVQKAMAMEFPLQRKHLHLKMDSLNWVWKTKSGNETSCSFHISWIARGCDQQYNNILFILSDKTPSNDTCHTLDI